MASVRRRHGILAVAAGLLGTAMCVGEFDTTRAPRDPANTTVGEEVFRVVCERVDVAESPTDIDFQRARPVCTGQRGADTTKVGPKVRTLGARRSALVAAFDRTIPRELYGSVDDMLVRLLPLYGPDNGVTRDGGTVRLVDGGRALAEELLPPTTRAMARLLGALAEDPEATRALARFSRHQGYRPPRVALGLTRTLLSYERVGDVLDSTLALFREAGPDGPEGAGRAHFETLLDVLRGELTNAGPSEDPRGGTTLDATIDLLFRQDPALSTGRQRLLVRRDHRGMPLVATAASGDVLQPFVDTNGDRLADASDAARFLDERGHPLDVPSPFPANETPEATRDEAGRALYNGVPMYQYIDLDQTVMAALLRDARTLLDPAENTAMRFLNGASVLFGSRTEATRDYMLPSGACEGPSTRTTCRAPALHYRAFEPSTGAPLIDVVHALGIALNYRDIDRVLSLAQALMRDREAPLARAMAAMLEINRVAQADTRATIDPRSNVWDDVMDVARRIAQMPGLLEDVVRAMADPRSAELGRAFADFIRHRDRIEPVWTSSQQNASLASRTLTRDVDLSRPDTQDLTSRGPSDNRSIFQRFLHLVHDLNGVRLCNREGAYIRTSNGSFYLRWPLTGGYRECELIEIPDAAIFYLQAIDGSARMEMRDSTFPAWLARNFSGTVDTLLEDNSGIEGFDQTPTPEAINRFVFQPDALRTPFTRALMDPVRTRDGIDVRTIHPATLFALEVSRGGRDAYEVIRPLVHAFVSHGTEGAHLFVELISALHLHYATRDSGQYQNTNPRGALYSTQDGVRTYEGIMAAAFSGDLVPATQALASGLPSIDAGAGMNGVDATAALARLLLDPNAIPGIAYRDGRTSTLRSDGTTRVDRPSLYYLFADAFNAMDAIFAGAPAEYDDWRAARSNIVDTFLAVDGAPAPSARFRNRAIPVVTRLVLAWVRDRIAAHRSLGDLDPWARGLASRLADTVRSPVFSSALDVLLDIYRDVPARAAAGGLMMHLFDDSDPSPHNAFGTTLTSAADLLQILRADADVDPLLHALAMAFQRRVPSADDGSLMVREEVVPIALRFLNRSRAYDSDHVLDRLLANLVSRPAEPELADEPLVVIGDAIAETHRLRPGTGGPLSAEDFREVLRQVREFFTDESRGMEQFYYIVQHRRL